MTARALEGVRVVDDPHTLGGRWSLLPPDPFLLAAIAGPSDHHHPAAQHEPGFSDEEAERLLTPATAERTP